MLSDQGLEDLGFAKTKVKDCYLLRYWYQRNDKSSFKNLTEEQRIRLHKELESVLPAIILQLPDSEQMCWLNRWRNSKDPLFHPSAPVDGFTLQTILETSSGPWIGKLIDLLSKEKAFGRLQNIEEVFDFARHWWDQNQPFCD